ncbi:hypothetical protein [Curtobacterium sp. MCLR17_045]|uniref:hypothetical protein n=1 Tax=Curtobacterium sp. MCLR17_045 TaxID=2175629 RepID=UPI0011B4AA51|nr:hypothetical protein [Curtobacterium sp. MCLR17_045]
MRSMLHDPRTRKRSLAAAMLGALALFGSLLVATPANALNDTGTGGVFMPTSGRVLDTAKGTGGFSTPMEAGKYRTIKVAGLAGLPDDGSVGAVSLNATVGASAGNGTLFGRPDADSGRTTMLIYNGVSGEYTSNTATVAVGADGTIQVMTESSARLILDVQGYYTANTDGTAAGGFVPVAKRIVDTRSGMGAAKVAIAPGKSIDVQITGANGIPAGASGAVVNVVAVNATDADGYLTPYATGGTKPVNSLHYAPSATTSIQAQIPLSADGKITIANSTTTTNLIVDLQGYFTAAGKGGAVFTPSYGRAYDSRATGNTALAENETRSIQIAGTAGVPVMGSGITAVVLTLIAVHGGSNGNADVWADGTIKPNTTAINFQTNDIETNTITVPLGANGKISLHNSAKATDYVVDVQGWYANPQAPTISCPAQYANGSWVDSLPASPVSCTVSAPAALSSDATLFTLVDGDSSQEYPLSPSGKTTVATPVTAAAGWHTVDAIVMQSDGSSFTESIAFGLNDGAPSATVRAIEAANPEVFLGLSPTAPDVTARYALQTSGEQTSSVPSNADDDVTVTSTDTETGATSNLSAGLPFAATASTARSEANGIVSFDNGNGSYTVPVSHADGSLAINTVLTGPSSPTSFAYPLELPKGGSVSVEDNGAVQIEDASGMPVGFVDAPWAVDANGADVPTKFVVSGNVVTQQIDTSAPGVQFPVVADPSLWSVIGSAVGCAAEISSLAFAGAKVLETFVKAEKILRGIRKAIYWYNKLGGSMKKVVGLLKKYVQNRHSLSEEQVEAVSGLFHEGGKTLLNIIGLGSCWSLATAKY